MVSEDHWSKTEKFLEKRTKPFEVYSIVNSIVYTV